jgi:hypothetical protein
MIRLKKNEPFDMGGKVFVYDIVDGKINLKPTKRKFKALKVFVPPTNQEVVDFFILKGKTEDIGNSFFNYYNGLEWKDKNDEPVKNWKAKALSIWFKNNEEKPQYQKSTPSQTGFKFFQ